MSDDKLGPVARVRQMLEHNPGKMSKKLNEEYLRRMLASLTLTELRGLMSEAKNKEVMEKIEIDLTGVS